MEVSLGTVTQEIILACRQLGRSIPDGFASYIASLIFDPTKNSFFVDNSLGNRSARELVESAVRLIFAQDSEFTSLVQLQCDYYSLVYDERQSLLKDFDSAREEFEGLIWRYVDTLPVTMGGHEFELLTQLYNNLLSLVLYRINQLFVLSLKAGGKRPADNFAGVSRQFTPTSAIGKLTAEALHAAFPRVSMRSLLRLSREERASQVQAVCDMVIGMRVYNAEMGLPADGLPVLAPATEGVEVEEALNWTALELINRCSSWRCATLGASAVFGVASQHAETPVWGELATVAKSETRRRIMQSHFWEFARSTIWNLQVELESVRTNFTESLEECQAATHAVEHAVNGGDGEVDKDVALPHFVHLSQVYQKSLLMSAWLSGVVRMVSSLLASLLPESSATEASTNTDIAEETQEEGNDENSHNSMVVTRFNAKVFDEEMRKMKYDINTLALKPDILLNPLPLVSWENFGQSGDGSLVNFEDFFNNENGDQTSNDDVDSIRAAIKEVASTYTFDYQQALANMYLAVGGVIAEREANIAHNSLSEDEEEDEENEMMDNPNKMINFIKEVIIKTASIDESNKPLMNNDNDHDDGFDSETIMDEDESLLEEMIIRKVEKVVSLLGKNPFKCLSINSSSSQNSTKENENNDDDDNNQNGDDDDIATLVFAGYSSSTVENRFESPEDFDDLSVDLGGYCIWTFVKFGGLLKHGDPAQFGVVSYKGKFLSFVSENARNEFMNSANKFWVGLFQGCCKFPACIELLSLGEYFPNQNLETILAQEAENLEPGQFLSLPFQKNVACETELHPVASRIEPGYTWNEWDLRRQALKIADLRQKATHSTQTVLSHFKRENETQTYLPKENATQTRRETGTKPVVWKRYIQGLRGGGGFDPYHTFKMEKEKEFSKKKTSLNAAGKNILNNSSNSSSSSKASTSNKIEHTINENSNTKLNPVGQLNKKIQYKPNIVNIVLDI